MSPKKNSPAPREALRVAERAAHDIAKYMSITARNVSPKLPIDDELFAAIRGDLQKTGGGKAAWVLWGKASSELARLWEPGAIVAIDETMKALEGLLIRAEGDASQREELVRKTVSIADAITSLKRQIRDLAQERT